MSQHLPNLDHIFPMVHRKVNPASHSDQLVLTLQHLKCCNTPPNLDHIFPMILKCHNASNLDHIFPMVHRKVNPTSRSDQFVLTLQHLPVFISPPCTNSISP
uniref:Uncharacterized protein n=1 Tax=Anguilla anguilla TaxID=7936 RepID=A0A0E9WJ16_ANGAN